MEIELVLLLARVLVLHVMLTNSFLCILFSLTSSVAKSQQPNWLDPSPFQRWSQLGCGRDLAEDKDAANVLLHLHLVITRRRGLYTWAGSDITGTLTHLGLFSQVADDPDSTSSSICGECLC